MARGGKRPGAGRPKGSVSRLTKVTQEVAIAAAAAGETPLDYMLRLMRDPAVPTVVQIDLAKAAAPYMHPKLSSAEVSGKDGESLQSITVNIMRFADPETGLVSAGSPPPRLIEH